jgi:hypothetical protein
VGAAREPVQLWLAQERKMASNLLCAPPWQYVAVVALFVVFHVGRGMIGQTRLNTSNRLKLEPWQAIWVIYAHDALLHLCCTVFGFLCLLLAYRLAEAHSVSELSGIVFLALAGLAGITGQLAVAFSLGKLPSPG